MNTLNLTGSSRLAASVMADQALEMHFKLHECLEGRGTTADLDLIDEEIANLVLLMKQVREQNQPHDMTRTPIPSVSQLAKEVVMVPILKMGGGRHVGGRACTS